MEIGHYPSGNGKDTITYYVYRPKAAPRAVVQICHGMCEYLRRYDHFAAFLNDRGILVCGNDHLGHGSSAAAREDYGYFGEKEGWKHLVGDAHRLTLRTKEAYPDVPYFLMGHSMGSFITRACLSRYGNAFSGGILLGTSGTNRMAPLYYPGVRALARVRGGHYRSALISKLAFGTYNTRFKPHRTQFDWISRDEDIVARYNEDRRCNFLFTLNGFLDLYYLLDSVSGRKWAERVPVDLPVLLMSGGMDPVGRRGRGVKEVHDHLALAGLKDLIMKLYPGCRHELLNEANRDRVYEDIYRWIEKRL